MIHELKIHSEHYERVKAGTKTFEIRVNDRGFQKGDFVYLYRWLAGSAQPNIKAHTSESDPALHFKIGDVYPIDAERVVFSLLPIGEE